MRYAIYPVGESEISQFLVVPDRIIKQVTPPGFSFVLVEEDVNQETHIILDGIPTLRTME